MTSASFRTRLLRSLSKLIGWFFGTFWAVFGASALPRLYARTGFAVAGILALFFIVRLWKHDAPTDAGRPLFKTLAYLIALAAELVGIYAAALLLPRFGAQQQVYPVVGCIVGLHFVGLWFATRNTRFLYITAGMCVVSLLSVLLPFTRHNIGARYVLLGAGNAIVLWLAASGTQRLALLH